MRTRLTVLLLVAISLAACSAGITPTNSGYVQLVTPTTSPTPPAPASPTASQTEQGTPTSSPSNDTTEKISLTQYTLDVNLNYDRHLAVIHEEIIYINQTEDILNNLVLIIEPLNYPNVFQLQKIAWENGQQIENYVLDGSLMRIPLGDPLQIGEKVQLRLEYELALPSPVQSPSTRPVPFGYSHQQTNLVDWYPFVAPYLTGKGWIAHPPFYYGEHLASESSDYDISLLVESSYPDLVIAASALDAGDETHHHYHLEAARSFAFSISHEYEIFTSQVGGVTVFSYAFPAHSQAGEKVLQTTMEALTLFNELFGPYPHRSLSVVEADFLDGMEYDGMFFLSNGFYNLYTGTESEYLVAIAVHETAHQWWYGLIGNDQALEPWLDEALCTYSERLFYEKKHPEALDWWWAYRVNYYEPSGWVNTTIYNPEGESQAYSYYRNAVYLNGAKFLEDLRKLIGDQAFFDFIIDYAGQYRQKIVNAQDFFFTLKQHTQQDLSVLIAQYFKLP